MRPEQPEPRQRYSTTQPGLHDVSYSLPIRLEGAQQRTSSGPHSSPFVAAILRLNAVFLRLVTCPALHNRRDAAVAGIMATLSLRSRCTVTSGYMRQDCFHRWPNVFLDESHRPAWKGTGKKENGLAGQPPPAPFLQPDLKTPGCLNSELHLHIHAPGARLAIGHVGEPERSEIHAAHRIFLVGQVA